MFEHPVKKGTCKTCADMMELDAEHKRKIDEIRFRRETT
jgi:hypothetical protein